MALYGLILPKMCFRTFSWICSITPIRMTGPATTWGLLRASWQLIRYPQHISISELGTCVNFGFLKFESTYSLKPIPCNLFLCQSVLFKMSTPQSNYLDQKCKKFILHYWKKYTTSDQLRSLCWASAQLGTGAFLGFKESRRPHLRSSP